ncbi:MAG: NAD+ synthase [Pseudomonadota bacterium]
MFDHRNKRENLMRLSERISRWIRDQVEGPGAAGVLVGLSGGIDSAVVAVLAQRAMGDHVLGLLLPCYSLLEDERDAMMIADTFRIRRERVDLSPVYETLLQQLPEAGEMCRVNLKPRLRMTALYYYANKLNYLVAGTGNKSELLMGYFTKFGDGGVDLLPLGDLTKSQVRKLAEELKIPQRIIERPPSAGLWRGQTDEEDMKIRYEDLDKIIVSLEKRKEAKLPKAQLTYVKGMMARSRHKRSTPPIFHLKSV